MNENSKAIGLNMQAVAEIVKEKIADPEGYPKSWDLEENDLETGHSEQTLTYLERSNSQVQPNEEKQEVRQKGQNDVSAVLGWLEIYGFRRLLAAVMGCGAKFMGTSCKGEKKHYFVKRIRCNREICPVCGQLDSELHRRRWQRAWPRLMWVENLGYVTLTLPVEYREQLFNKEKFKALFRAAWETVDEVFSGYFETAQGGLVVSHFFGDQGDRFNPHFNVLFSTTGRVSEGVLDRLREVWRRKFFEVIGEDILEGEKTFVVYYEYSSDSKHFERAVEKARGKGDDPPSREQVNFGMKVHWLKYILRPTLTFSRFGRLGDELALRIAILLYSGRRFCNVHWYGDLRNSYYRTFFIERDIRPPVFEQIDNSRQTFLCTSAECAERWGAPVESDNYRCPECGGWCKLRSVCPVCGELMEGFYVHSHSSEKVDESKSHWVFENENVEKTEIWLKDPQGEIVKFVEVGKGTGYYAELQTFKDLMQTQDIDVDSRILLGIKTGVD